ncbi:MAG: hypothetical protein Rubg2KO_26730 [Rubricoccaceae bacterium]
MSPAFEVVLPEWSLPSLQALRERWAEEWGHVSVCPDVYITLGEDGMPEERLRHQDAQRWDLRLRSAQQQRPAPITVYVSPCPPIDPDFEHTVGWKPQGILSPLAWKSVPDAATNAQIIAALAQDAARSFGGVVAIDTHLLPDLIPRIGHLYHGEGWSYVDAELFERIKDHLRW